MITMVVIVSGKLRHVRYITFGPKCVCHWPCQILILFNDSSIIIVNAFNIYDSIYRWSSKSENRCISFTQWNETRFFL